MPISYWLILGLKKHSIPTLKKDAAKLFWGIFFVTDKAQAFSEGGVPLNPPSPEGGNPPRPPPLTLTESFKTLHLKLTKV